MQRLMGPGWKLAHKDVDRLVDKMSLSLSTIIGPGETVGVYADISRESVLVVLALIRHGQRIAILPQREPASVLEHWCHALGLTKVLFTCAPVGFCPPGIMCIDTLQLLSSPQQVGRDVMLGAPCATILRTSGTTATPKTAVISEKAHRASAEAVGQFFNFKEGDSWALNLPLYHVSGLSIIFRALAANAGIFVAKTADDLCYAVNERLVTHLSLVPTQLKRLLESSVDLSGLKAIIVGGDELPEALKSQALLRALPIYETYGLTETASMIWARDCRNGQAGIVLPHAFIKLAVDREILVGGSSLFDGYLEADHEILAGPLFKTGDLSDDLFSTDRPLITGRKSNRIIVGGENVQVEEVERILEKHPAIMKSVVIGKKDSVYGMRPVAYVKWCGEPIGDEELTAYLIAHLARHKIPTAFLPWPTGTPDGIKKPRSWFLSQNDI